MVARFSGRARQFRRHSLTLHQGDSILFSRSLTIIGARYYLQFATTLSIVVIPTFVNWGRRDGGL